MLRDDAPRDLRCQDDGGDLRAQTLHPVFLNPGMNFAQRIRTGAGTAGSGEFLTENGARDLPVVPGAGGMEGACGFYSAGIQRDIEFDIIGEDKTAFILETRQQSGKRVDIILLPVRRHSRHRDRRPEAVEGAKPHPLCQILLRPGTIRRHQIAFAIRVAVSALIGIVDKVVVGQAQAGIHDFDFQQIPQRIGMELEAGGIVPPDRIEFAPFVPDILPERESERERLQCAGDDPTHAAVQSGDGRIDKSRRIHCALRGVRREDFRFFAENRPLLGGQAGANLCIAAHPLEAMRRIRRVR